MPIFQLRFFKATIEFCICGMWPAIALQYGNFAIILTFKNVKFRNCNLLGLNLVTRFIRDEFHPLDCQLNLASF
jgi:hypothetical protein